MNAYWRILILAAIGIVPGANITQAQVINFDVPGGAGAANYSGQGAYADPGNNYWNPIAGGGTTAATNRLSDGITGTPITLTSQMGGTYGTQGGQGTPAGLQQPYEYNNVALRTDILSHVPAGTYNLYLYGINNTGTRGTAFTASTSKIPPISQSTSNTPASLTAFVLGADYVIFSNLVVGTDGTITFTWAGNPNVGVSGNNEGDLNALQLVFVSTNTIVTNSVGPNFGPNVLLFYPSMSAATIQNLLNGIFALQNDVNASQFDANRFALLFEPGTYNVAVNMGYYMQVLGLGQSPDNVIINGALQCYNFGGQSTQNFWMSAENLAVIPTNSNSTMTWSVSQGTSLRRMHVKGTLNVSDGTYCSGGFLADSRVDSTVNSISQQQWLSRNDIWGGWSGAVWNMVFVGVSNPPFGTWPGPPYTIITNTPLIREKPYLCVDGNTNFFVMVPALRTNSLGTSWASGPTPGVSIPISQFYLAQPRVDNAGSINTALSSGLNLILTPGIYQLTNSILVTQPDTVIIGLGYPTLVPTNGNPAMVISDVNGVKVSDIIFDAGAIASPSLLEIGTATNSVDHSADPTCLFDICSRVGGEFVGTTTNCVTINANNVIGDNLWLWRADHGAGSTPYWTGNPSQSGLVVNGNDVTIYGLFVEHHQQYQTLWNGNRGRLYFYQSELPYDPPSQSTWSEAPGVPGYASYKVADSVTSHQAYGLGVYAVFINTGNANISCFNAIETPTNSQQVNVHDMMDVYIAGNGSGSGPTEIYHIINGTGSAVIGPGWGGTAYANYVWLNPTFSVNAAISGANLAASFPTESWHSYQLQYKNAVTDPGWSNFGVPMGGNDTWETIIDSTAASGRFYRVKAY